MKNAGLDSMGQNGSIPERIPKVPQMARKTKRILNFTKTELVSLPTPKSGRDEYWDEAVRGLLLRVTTTGHKSFSWVHHDGKKFRRKTIGTFPDVAIDAARRIAKGLAGAIAEGKEPVTKRAAATQEWTVAELWAWYLNSHAKPHKRSWRQDEKTYANHIQKLSRRKVSTVSRSDVSDWYQQIGESAGPQAANKSIAVLSHMYRLGHDLNPTSVPSENPCRGVKKFPTVERERFLDEDELPKWLRAVETLRLQVSRDALLLYLWTGARKMNVCTMRWDEISIPSRIWTVPKEKAKKKRDMRIPLTAPAIEILIRRQKTAKGPWVLPGRSRDGHYADPFTAMRSACKKAGLNDVRIHDLRRTLGSWLAIEHPLATVGQMLGHKPGSKSTAIYARLADRTVAKAAENATKRMQGTADSGEK